jgi:phosphoribosyl-ATP pyrophosphohydrolase
MSKWHISKIEKGTLGQLSKVREELEEAIDAEKQGQTLMLLFELSDIIGACGLVANQHGMTLDHLVTFSKLRSKVAKEETDEIVANEAMEKVIRDGFDKINEESAEIERSKRNA